MRSAKRRKLKLVSTNATVERTRQHQNAYENARERLQLSSIPRTLPCRQVEFLEIAAHIESSLDERSGQCIYVSGVPGTGKTATMRAVVRHLQQKADQGELPEFRYLEMNGMTLTDPNYAYVPLYELISGRKLSPQQSADALETHFNRPAKSAKTKPIVLLMDELDLLVNKKQTVIYNFFNWPTRPHSNLIVVAIANTMDLPERMLSNKVSSRLGLTRINFQPYTHQQLAEIIKSRLEGLDLFDAKAIEFCARKVSAVSGDARRALDICRRAAEIAQAKPNPSDVTIQVVMEAVDEMNSSATQRWLKNASLHQKLFIYALILRFKQSGLSEAQFGQVATRHIDLCRLHNLDPPCTSDLASVCLSLGASRILMTEAAKADLLQKIRLNIPEEDVTMAFRADDVMRHIVV